MPRPNYNRPIYYDESGTNQSSEQRTYTDNHNNTYQAGKYDYISSLATPQQVQSVYQQYGITPKDPPKPPVDYGNTGGGGGGGGGSSASGVYGSILKRLADAYNQRKEAQEVAYQQALKDQEYQDLLGRERNNSWLSTANRQVRNSMGDQNSGLAKYSQARNQTSWMAKQADTQMAGNAARANLNAQNMAKKADIEDAYAQTLYNLYNNQLQWEHYLRG